MFDNYVLIEFLCETLAHAFICRTRSDHSIFDNFKQFALFLLTQILLHRCRRCRRVYFFCIFNASFRGMHKYIFIYLFFFVLIRQLRASDNKRRSYKSYINRFDIQFCASFFLFQLLVSFIIIFFAHTSYCDQNLMCLVRNKRKINEKSNYQKCFAHKSQLYSLVLSLLSVFGNEFCCCCLHRASETHTKKIAIA